MAIEDVKIIETFDGGDLEQINDDLVTIEGLTNQVYLALFGGVSEETEWWGNNLFEDDQNKFVSSFQKKLNETVLNSSSIVDLENAAKEDLKYLEDYANIEIEASLIGLNKLQLDVILIQPDSEKEKITYIWDGTKNDITKL